MSIVHIMSQGAAGKRCPICGKHAEEKIQPFCSRRCADVDLHRWLSGSYAIPGAEMEDDPGAASDSNGKNSK